METCAQTPVPLQCHSYHKPTCMTLGANGHWHHYTIKYKQHRNYLFSYLKHNNCCIPWHYLQVWPASRLMFSICLSHSLLFIWRFRTKQPFLAPQPLTNCANYIYVTNFTVSWLCCRAPSSMLHITHILYWQYGQCRESRRWGLIILGLICPFRQAITPGNSAQRLSIDLNNHAIYHTNTWLSTYPFFGNSP